jgi:hypothetical protein
MINPKTNQRELAYIVKIDDIKYFEGVNNPVAIVNGWQVFVKDGEYQVGDLAVYFEIDSRLPAIDAFEFMGKYNYRVKTQKFVKGRVLSQGLLMKPDDLGLKNVQVGDFLTDQLGVSYADPEDNIRKANRAAAITSMKARHPKIFKTKLAKWLMKREWGKKLMFFLFGKKKDKKTDWPHWVVKTDEERCQNCFQSMKDLNIPWYVTEKIDGTSTTFTMKQNKPKKRKLLVCSRNVVYDKPEKENKNFYRESDGNVYLEMADRYKMELLLSETLTLNPTLDFITVQGETYGGGIQKRNYGPVHKFAVFNIIFAEKGCAPKKLNPQEVTWWIRDMNKHMKKKLTHWIPLESVPLVCCNYKLPKTCEELLEYSGSVVSQIDGGMREGIVLRSADGKYSFKAVDNEFLLKYHQ